MISHDILRYPVFREIHVCVYIHIYTCMYIYIYIYIHMYSYHVYACVYSIALYTMVGLPSTT